MYVPHLHFHMAGPALPHGLDTADVRPGKMKSVLLEDILDNAMEKMESVEVLDNAMKMSLSQRSTCSTNPILRRGK